jgi:rubrerythrin
MSRAEILSRGARAGVALTVGGSALAVLSADASAATLPDDDLAYVRLLVASELLAIDFYSRAIASNQIDGKALARMKHALANEKAHYQSLSAVLAGAGQVAATADDINFTYPRGSFSSAASIGKLGIDLERTMLGAYLGAVEGLQTNPLRRAFAQIAANEAQHLSVLSGEWLGRPIGKAFAASMTIDQASDALDAYES